MLTVTGPTAAAELRVSVPTVRRMAAAGLIPVVTSPGRHPGYDAEAVQILADRPGVAFPDPFFAVRLAPAQNPLDAEGDLVGWNEAWYGRNEHLRALAGWWPVDPERVLEQTDVIAAFVGGIGVAAARITGVSAIQPNTGDGRSRVQFTVAHDADVDAQFRWRWCRRAAGWASGILTSPV